MRNKVQSLILVVSAVILVVVFLSLGVGPSLDNVSNNDKLLNNRFALDLSKQTKQDEDNQEEQIIALDIDTIPTNEGYLFLGYAWESTATTPDYVYDSDTNTFTPSTITLNSNNPNRTLFAIWENLNRIDNISDAIYMQQVNEDVCNSMTMDKRYTLIDQRDNNSYQIAKLKDNHCWMMQNLTLMLDTSITLTNTLTDLNSKTSWTPDTKTMLKGNWGSNNSNISAYSYYDQSYTNFGVYYSWSAAVASNNTSSMTAQYTNAPDSICPKGWRLPLYNGSSTSNTEFSDLLFDYDLIKKHTSTSWAAEDSFSKIQSTLSIPLSGHIDGGVRYDFNESGFLWSAGIASSSAAYRLYFKSSTVYASRSDSRSNAMPIRCIVR